MLDAKTINDAWDASINADPTGAQQRFKFASAIESAATAPLLERIAALEAKLAQRVLPDGCQLVPIEPTEEMIDAGCDVDALKTAIESNRKRFATAAVPLGHDFSTAWKELRIRYSAMLAAAPAAPEHQEPTGRPNDAMCDYIEGMEVSVDVSTGEHDAGHRYFGTVTEVMDNRDSKHGVILLVQNPEPNFDIQKPSVGYELVHRATGKVHRTVQPGDALALDSWEERECDVLQAVAQAPNAQQTEAQPVAWINYPVICDAVGNFSGYGRAELSFTQVAYGFDINKSQPLYTAPPKEKT